VSVLRRLALDFSIRWSHGRAGSFSGASQAGVGPSRHGHLVECVGTLRPWLPLFDTGWWTLYSFLRTAHGRPQVATLQYRTCHVEQMRALAPTPDEPAFRDISERWASYSEGRECRVQFIVATLRGSPGRVLRGDAIGGGA
jgi:hypothetical protein